MKGSGSSDKNSPVPTSSAGTSNSSMFSHNPASILASLSSPGKPSQHVYNNNINQGCPNPDLQKQLYSDPGRVLKIQVNFQV